MNQDALDYIVNVVQKASSTINFRIFVTPKDFDIIYRWWEKSIPINLVSEAMYTVFQRWQKKGKDLKSYSSFNYEVKKNFKTFTDMKAGGGNYSKDTVTQKTPLDTFFDKFPKDLEFCETIFKELKRKVSNGETCDVEELNSLLIHHFREDEFLMQLCDNFLEGLSPELRTDKIKERYLLNSIYDKYKIPEFDLF